MEWLRRLATLFRRGALDRDLDEEMRIHLDMQTEENRAGGMDAEEARYAARRQFGNPTLLKESGREAWGWVFLDRLAQDVRYAVRTLRKSPGFTVVALLTLAAGIGANTVIFSVVRGVLLAPLPYTEPGRLAMLYAAKGERGDRIMMSAPDATDLRSRTTAFTDVAIAGYTSADFVSSGEPERLTGSRVSGNLFAVLGVAPFLGRSLEQGDDLPNAPPVVVLSHALWHRRFGADAAVIGRSIPLGKQVRTIVGVMPPGFYFPTEKTEFWIPLGADEVRYVRGDRMFRVVGRLKPGAAIGQARTEAKGVATVLESAWPQSNRGWSVEVAPLIDAVVGDVREALLILLGAVGMVLLIACANVANLLLARGAARRREIAVRAALGAGRRRLARLLLVESLLLALAGGAVGVTFASWGLGALLPLYPPGLPRVAEIRLNAPVLAFTFVLSVVTGLLFGLLPALRLSRADLNSALRSGARSGGLQGGHSRRALVVAQVSLATVLLICAGLLVKSFLLRTRVAGFDPSNVLMVNLPDLPAARVAAIVETVRALPGVSAAGAGNSIPNAPAMSTEIEIQGKQKSDTRLDAIFDIVTADYFRVLRMPIRRGRVIEERDAASAPAVAVINEALARRYFPGEDPLGRQLRWVRISASWITIVGVVGDSTPFGADRETRPAMYLSFRQHSMQPGMLLVRTAVAPHAVAPAIRSVIRSLEPGKPMIAMQTVEEDLSRRAASPRFYMLLLGAFALLALALAVLGVYGVISFVVSARTHEIGVRMALGASGGDVLASVLREGMTLALLGTAIGVAAALGATRLLVSLLFRVKPADPLTFACVGAALLAAAAAACWAPARRATRVDPMEALRYE